MNTNKKYTIKKEIKDEILDKVKHHGLTVKQASEDYGVSTKTIYRWLTNGVSGQPTWTQVTKLKREIKMLKELVGDITIELSKTKKKN